MNYKFKAFLLWVMAIPFIIKSDTTVVSVFSHNVNFQVAKTQAV